MSFADPTLLRNDYDFIIVGGGTAGSVIANRLSENKNWNILVLEAGQPESTLNFVPLFVGYLIKSTYDWGYVSEKTPGSCLLSDNDRCPYHGGRALGGSSAINYMLFTRGNRKDFDEWEQAGNEGWGYEGVLPYFKKFETANIKNGFDPKYRGSTGEMIINYPPYQSGLTNFFVEAAKAAGHELVDYNGEKQLGVSYTQANVHKGKRFSAASAFLHPIYKIRKNLHIITSALVSKVLIDKDTKTAMGVVFTRDGQSYSVLAKKEVILAAGALHSPQLLMLSGIGPSDQLKALDIDVIQDLPVGKRYYDHNVFTGLTYTTNTTNAALHIKRIGALEVLEFIEGKGSLTSPANIEALVYGKMKDSPLHPDQPDYELIMFPGSWASDLGTSLGAAYNMKISFYDSYVKPLESTRIDHFSILVHQMRPQSFGYMKLRDKDIKSAPLFYHNFYTNPADLEPQLAGIRAGQRIAEASVMKGIGAKLYSIPIPGCTHHTFDSDDYWRCAIRVASIGTHHQTGTCRMGPEGSKDAVVDSKLRVHGVKRLRVADNSIIPSMICAHTHAAALMIGEKFSDIIKSDWVE